MAKYIDKSALVAEIEKRLEEYRTFPDYQTDSKYMELCEILSFISTLETKEEILDKEGKTKLMKKCVHKAYKRGYDMGVLKTTNEMNHNMKDVDLEEAVDDAKDLAMRDMAWNVHVMISEGKSIGEIDHYVCGICDF